MKKIKELYQHSLLELTVTRNVVLCGLLAALAIVLGMVASISVGPYVRIGFSGLPTRIVEFLFGPAAGCLFSGALDILKYVIKPDGPYFFGFTLSAMLSGIIYGSIFYRKPVTVKRILLAEFLIKLLINCILNTLWLNMLYGQAFFALLPLRMLKNAIMLPIDSFILYFALTFARKLTAHLGFLPAGAAAGNRS